MAFGPIGFARRIMRLCRRVAPFRRRRERRRPPQDEQPAGPKLIPGRGLQRRRKRTMSKADFFEILFWTLIGLAVWTFVFLSKTP